MRQVHGDRQVGQVLQQKVHQAIDKLISKFGGDRRNAMSMTLQIGAVSGRFDGLLEQLQHIMEHIMQMDVVQVYSQPGMARHVEEFGFMHG